MENHNCISLLDVVASEFSCVSCRQSFKTIFSMNIHKRLVHNASLLSLIVPVSYSSFTPPFVDTAQSTANIVPDTPEATASETHEGDGHAEEAYEGHPSGRLESEEREAEGHESEGPERDCQGEGQSGGQRDGEGQAGDTNLTESDCLMERDELVSAPQMGTTTSPTPSATNQQTPVRGSVDDSAQVQRWDGRSTGGDHPLCAKDTGSDGVGGGLSREGEGAHTTGMLDGQSPSVTPRSTSATGGDIGDRRSTRAMDQSAGTRAMDRARSPACTGKRSAETRTRSGRIVRRHKPFSPPTERTVAAAAAVGSSSAESVDRDSEFIAAPPEQEPYVCKLCERSYTTWRSLQFHEHRMHRRML